MLTRKLQSIARRLARVVVKNDHLWRLTQCVPGASFFAKQRTPIIRKRAARQCVGLFSDRRVLAGPFQGLRYADALAVGSMLWPKLLGTYESELRPVFERLFQTKRYKHIVDIGFAEGYYLVGLGNHFQDAELIGFDIEDEAKTLCVANARENGIEDQRLKLFGAYDTETFRDVLQEESLVLVDCEGFENDVIEGLSTDQLQKADWLIETHDHLVEGTTERLKSRLEVAHEVIEITTDSMLQAKCGLLPEDVKQAYCEEVQEALVYEGRKAKQSWILATRKAA